MLPMGTIVTVCMLLGLLFAAPYALNVNMKPTPRVLALVVGSVVFVAGAWNTFWHGIQNLTDFWGLAALISGVLMMLTALYIMRFDTLPDGVKKVRALVLLGLLAWFVVYAVTLYRL